MTPERLGSLAVCHINAKRLPALDVIEKSFIEAKNRRLEFIGSNSDLSFLHFLYWISIDLRVLHVKISVSPLAIKNINTSVVFFLIAKGRIL